MGCCESNIDDDLNLEGLVSCRYSVTDCSHELENLPDRNDYDSVAHSNFKAKLQDPIAVNQQPHVENLIDTADGDIRVMNRPDSRPNIIDFSNLSKSTTDIILENARFGTVKNRASTHENHDNVDDTILVESELKIPTKLRFNTMHVVFNEDFSRFEGHPLDWKDINKQFGVELQVNFPPFLDTSFVLFQLPFFQLSNFRE